MLFYAGCWAVGYNGVPGLRMGDTYHSRLFAVSIVHHAVHVTCTVPRRKARYIDNMTVDAPASLDALPAAVIPGRQLLLMSLKSWSRRCWQLTQDLTSRTLLGICHSSSTGA